MAKKKKVNHVIPPEAPEVVPEAVDDVADDVEDVSGRDRLRARIEDRAAEPVPVVAVPAVIEGAVYDEYTDTCIWHGEYPPREVRYGGARWEHACENDKGQWVYTRS